VNAIEVCNGELYSTSSRGELFKWSINDGLIAKIFPKVHFNEIQSFACKSQHLFTGTSDATIIRWDASTGNVTFIYDQGNFRIRSIVSWKKYIISAGEDAEIRKWDASIDSIYPFAVFDNNRTVINTLLVYDDYVYSGENFGAIKEIRLSNLTIIRTFNSKIMNILSLIM
jgi:WD40 repeat protein